MDKTLMILSIIGVLTTGIREIFRFRKDIYNPYVFSLGNKNDKGLYKFIIILLTTIPPIWIENPDYKKTTYIIIIFSLFLWMNILNVLSIFKSSTSVMKKTRVIVKHTIIANILIIGSLLVIILIGFK